MLNVFSRIKPLNTRGVSTKHLQGLLKVKHSQVWRHEAFVLDQVQKGQFNVPPACEIPAAVYNSNEAKAGKGTCL